MSHTRDFCDQIPETITFTPAVEAICANLGEVCRTKKLLLTMEKPSTEIVRVSVRSKSESLSLVARVVRAHDSVAL